MSSLIGSDTITLVDLTDVRPISLNLSTSLSTTQIKKGKIYEPDYSKENGQVITPSLFLGQTEVETKEYVEKIEYTYNVNGEEKGIYSYGSSTISDGIYVDNNGRLILKKNSQEPVTIEVEISDIEDYETGIKYSTVYGSVKINTLSYENGYTAIIESKDGRYHFEDNNIAAITLSAILYSGIETVTENLTYHWYASSIGDEEGQELGTEQTLTIPRGMVHGHETFICKIKLNETDFITSIGIDDRTDIYTAEFIAGGSTVLTPSNSKVELNVNLLKNGEIYNPEENILPEIQEGDGINLLRVGSNSNNLVSFFGTGKRSTNNQIRPWRQANFYFAIKPFSSGESGLEIANIGLKAGTYTLSFYSFSSKQQNLQINYGLFNSSGENLSESYTSELGVYSGTSDAQSNIKKFTVTFSINSDESAAKCKIWLNSSNILTTGNVFITNIKLEAGSTATAWSANPLDGDIEIVKYNWYYFTSESKDVKILESLTGARGEITRTLLNSQSAMVFCKVELFEVGGRIFYATANIPIEMSSNFQAVVTPSLLSIPCNFNGTSKNSFTRDISFKLLNDNNQPLPFEEGDSDINLVITNLPNGKTLEDYFKVTTKTNTVDTWDKIISLSSGANTDFSAFSEESIEFEIQYSYLGVSFVKTFAIVLNRQGEQGERGPDFLISLTNDFHRFAGGEATAKGDQETEIGISVTYGGQPIAIKEVAMYRTGSDRISLDSTYNWNIVNGLGIRIEETPSDSTEETKVILTTGNGSTDRPFLNSGGELTFYITTADPEYTFVKTFQYEINYNGNSYSLQTDPETIYYDNIAKKFKVEQIIINATYREANMGGNIAYNTGYIFYQIDDDTNINLGVQKSASFTFNTSNLSPSNKKITFYLCGSQCEGEYDEKYLLEKEVVEITTYVEDVTIERENLLKWTKKFQISPEKWLKSNSEDLSIGAENDFSYLHFTLKNTTNTWLRFRSPQIPIQEDFIGQDFTLSFYIKVEDWENFGGPISINFWGFKNINSNWRDGFTSYYLGGSKDNDTPGIEIEGKKVKNQWIRVKITFNLHDDFFSATQTGGIYSEIEDEIPKVSECKFWGVSFYKQTGPGDIKILKPKLERGKYPSNWSASPYDIDYSSVQGFNLVNGAKLKFKVFGDDGILLTNSLHSNTYYTLSWQTIERENLSSNTGSYCVYNNNDTENPIESGTFSWKEKNFIKTFYLDGGKEDNFSIYLYSYNINDSSSNNSNVFTFRELKLEEGQQATGFSMSTEELKGYLSSIGFTIEKDKDDNGKEVGTTTHTYTTWDGEVISFTNIDNLITYLEGNTGVQEAITGIGYITGETLSNRLDGLGLSGERKAIDIKWGNEDETLTKDPDTGLFYPYIEISTKSAKDAISLVLQDDKLAFYQSTTNGPYSDDDRVAYLSNQKLYIKEAELTNQLRIGKPKGGFLTFKTYEDFTGVVVCWETEE